MQTFQPNCKQIRELRVAADEHNVKQDEQLQIITTLRIQLEERIKSLQSVLDEVKGPDPVAREHQNEQLVASTIHTRVDQLSEVLEIRADQLESAMKEQKQLMLALKSFLEDKTSRSGFALESGNQSVEEKEGQSSWPSATLSTAYFAALLLSSVLSSVAVTSIVTKHRSFRGTARPVFVPVDYSLPGLGVLNKIQVQPSLIQRVDKMDISPPAVETRVTKLSTHDKPSMSTKGTVTSIQDQPSTSTRGICISTQAKLKDATPTKASEWVHDYSRTQRAVRQPNEQTSRPERREMTIPYSTGPGWSKRLAKLNRPGQGNGPEGDHDVPDDNHGDGPEGGEPDNGFHDGPGPVIPSPNPVFRPPSPVIRSPSPVHRRSPSPVRSTPYDGGYGWRSSGGGGGRPPSSSSSSDGGRYGRGGGGGRGSDSDSS